MTTGRLGLYLYARKNAHFSLTYEAVYETDSLKSSGCNGPLIYIWILVVSLSDVASFASMRPTLASEVQRESS